MVLTADRQRVKDLLTETITLLCKNGLHFKTEFCIEALIGITLDQNDVFLVNIKETVTSDGSRFQTQTSLQSKKENVEEICQRRMQKALQNEAPAVSSLSSSSSSSSSLPDKSKDSTVVATELSQASSSPRTLVKRKSSTCDMQLCKKTADKIVCNSKATATVKSYTSATAETNYSAASESCGINDSVQSTESPEEFLEPRLKIALVEEGNNEKNSDHQNSSDVIVIKEEGLSDEEQKSNVSECSQPFSLSDMYGSFSFGQSSPADVLPNAATSRNSYLRSSHPVDCAQNDQSGQTSEGIPNVSASVHPFVCRKCQRSFSSPQGRDLHEKLHDGIYRYKCSICGKGCSGTTQLRGHMALHTRIFEFKCPYCPVEYRYKRTLNEHIARSHVG